MPDPVHHHGTCDPGLHLCLPPDGLAPEAVHAVWWAAGQALAALDDATLVTHGWWYARQAGERVAAAAWQQQTASLAAEQFAPDMQSDLDRTRARRRQRRRLAGSRW